MTWRPQSVRVRLTLWYAAVMAATLLLFSLGVYFSVRTNLMRQANERLMQNAAAIQTLLANEPDELPELEEHGSVPLFQVTEDGAVLYRSAGWDRIGLDRALARPGNDPSWMWETPGDVHFVVRTDPVRIGARTLEVATAEEIKAVLRSLRSLSVILFVGFPLAVALALAGGYFLAGRVLAPVGRMASKAQEITAERLSERLPVANPEDEFGRLASVFNHTLQRLEHAFENLRRFTADASHELRTPLTALRSVGEVGLQEAGRSPASYRDVIGSMLEEADRLAALVDNLLTLTRGDAGQVPIHLEMVDLAALAKDVVNHLRVLAEEKGQDVTLAGATSLAATADRGKLRQALINLLDNAIKYTPSGGHIRVNVQCRGSESAVVEIVDTGPGIPPAHREKVFERFYRVDQGRSSDAGGAGLGLAIAEWAVRLSGGRVELESKEHRGSTFRVVLPAAKEDVNDTRRPSKNVSPPQQ